MDACARYKNCLDVQSFTGLKMREKTMKTEELELERRCRAHARRHGWVCCKLEKNGCKGIPDDLFISPEQRCWLVEFKKDEKQKPRPEQAVWLERFSKIAVLVGTFAEFCKVLQIEPNE